MKRALFLDRDGTVIEDRGYMHDPALVQFLPGAAAALSVLVREGWVLIVVSNQSGVGRGLITGAEADSVQTRFIEVMHTAGAPVTATYICPHRPDESCLCRKPSPFHVKQAALKHGLDLENSWMIGDRQSDILCGRNAKCRTIWLSNPLFPVTAGVADFVAQDWHGVREILAKHAKSG